MLAVAKETGLPLAEGLDSVADLPHTISFAVLYRNRIDSFHNLPKDKQPPRDLWDKPYRLEQFLDKIWDRGNNKTESTDMYEFDFEDVE